MENELKASAAVAVVAAPSKQERVEIRRRNLIMLTAARGAKIALTHAAGLTNSRVSLMTSGRKPVSDPFAHAIEAALGLPGGWLDTPQSRGTVPASAWQVLGEPPAETAAATGRNGRTSSRAGSVTDAALEALITPTALFRKPDAAVGPIAEALAKTILNLSRADRLSERKALQLLGALLNDQD